MADRFVFFGCCGELAHAHGYFACFMPKPFNDRASGEHLPCRWRVRTRPNLFADATDEGLALSPLAYQFIAGILKHLPALSAVVSPTVNSYKRLIRKAAVWLHLGIFAVAATTAPCAAYLAATPR